eukprot:scaffold2645_cov378-Prasinococcus_capsulatus_cf.AAC.11
MQREGRAKDKDDSREGGGCLAPGLADRSSVRNRTAVVADGGAVAPLPHVEGTRQRPWLAPNIRVRVVDKKLCKGAVYLKKAEVVDVLAPDVCALKFDDDRIVQDVPQRALETALPKKGGRAVVVQVRTTLARRYCTRPERQGHVQQQRNWRLHTRGKHRGQRGMLLERNAAREEVVLRFSSDFAFHTLRMDDVAEYTGPLDEEDCRASTGSFKDGQSNASTLRLVIVGSSLQSEMIGVQIHRVAAAAASVPTTVAVAAIVVPSRILRIVLTVAVAATVMVLLALTTGMLRAMVMVGLVIRIAAAAVVLMVLLMVVILVMLLLVPRMVGAPRGVGGRAHLLPGLDAHEQVRGEVGQVATEFILADLGAQSSELHLLGGRRCAPRQQ